MFHRAFPRDRARLLALAACVALAPGLGSAADALARGVTAAPARGSVVLGAEVGSFDYSGILSLDVPTEQYDVGPRLAAEAMYAAYDLTPQLRLLVGARAAFAYHGRSRGSLWLLEAVPDVKLRAALTEQIGVYGDFGLGLSFQHRSADAVGGGSFTDDSLPLTIQFGFGAMLALTQDLGLVSELRLATYTKSGSPVFFAVPTIGLMWRY